MMQQNLTFFFLVAEEYYALQDTPSDSYSTPVLASVHKRTGYTTAPTVGYTVVNGVLIPSSEFKPDVCTGGVHTLNVPENDDAYMSEDDDFSLTSVLTGLEKTLTMVDGTSSLFVLQSDGKISCATGLDFETRTEYELLLVYRFSGETPYLECKITVQVTNVNEAPVLTSGSVSATRTINENENSGTQVSIVVEGIDPDEMDQLTFRVTGGDQTKFTIDCSGSILTLAAFDFEEDDSYSIEVTATDSGGLYDAQNIVITVLDVQEPPTCTGATFTASEDLPIGATVANLASTATDPDAGDTITYSILFQSANKFEIISGDTVLLKEGLNFENVDVIVIEVQVKDSSGNVGSCSHKIEVTNVNDAPVFLPMIFSVVENCAGTECDLAELILFSMDEDGNALTFAVETGAVQISGGDTLSLSAPLDYETTKSITATVKANDGFVEVISSLIKIIVIDVNEVPVASNESGNIAENSAVETVVLQVDATDPENDIMVYTMVSITPDQPVFKIDSAGAIRVAQVPDHETTSSFDMVVDVCDGSLCVQKTVTIGVTDVNDAPTYSSIPDVNIDENSATSTTIGTPMTAVDQDGDVLVYTIKGGDPNTLFAIDASTAQLSVAGNLNYELATSFELEIRATDPEKLFATATVIVNVNDIAEAPYFLDTDSGAADFAATIARTGDSTYKAFVLNLDDPDSNQNGAICTVVNDISSRFEFVAQDPGTTCSLTISSSGGAVTDGTIYTVTVRATDVDATTLYTEIDLKVVFEGLNTPPTCVDTTFEVVENSLEDVIIGVVQGSAEDKDQVVEYSILTGNDDEYFTIDKEDGTLSVAKSNALDYESVTSYSLKIIVADNGPGKMTGTCTILITVIDKDEPPTCSTAERSVVENAMGAAIGDPLSSLCTDPDADDSTFVFSVLNFQTLVQVDGDQLKTIVALNFEEESKYELKLRVHDASATTLYTDFIIKIKVVDVNDAPKVSLSVSNPGKGGSARVLESAAPGEEIALFSISDEDTADTFTANGVSAPFLLFTKSTTEYSLRVQDQLNFEFETSYNITVVVTDSAGDTTSVFLVVQVEDVNEPPVFPSGQALFISEKSGRNEAALSRYQRMGTCEPSVTIGQRSVEKIEECMGACAAMMSCITGSFQSSTKKCLLSASPAPVVCTACSDCVLFSEAPNSASISALYLTGSKMAVHAPLVSNLNVEDWTIECWVKISSDVVSGTLLGIESYDTKKVQLELWLDISSIQLRLFGENYVIKTGVLDNRWHHVGWMYDFRSGGMQFYLDGKNVFDRPMIATLKEKKFDEDVNVIVGLESLACTCPTAEIYGLIDEVG